MADEERRPIVLLFNPAAGEKRGVLPGEERPSAKRLLDTLRRRGLTVELHELTPDDEAEELARAAASDGRDVVVAGGDGTVGAAAAGLVDGPGTLGIIPLGTFNNIARGAGIPTDVDAAMEVVARGRSAAIDAGAAWSLTAEEAARIRGEDGDLPDPPATATTFFEAAGVGLDAAGFGVAQVGERLGLFPAARMAWRAMSSRKTPIWMVIDGQRYRTLSPAVTICNGPFHGFGFELAPEADPADGLLEVVIFVRMTRLEVLRHFAGVARGRRRRDPRVRSLRAKHAVIAGQQRPLPAHADGRVFGSTPVAIAVRPGALRLFA